MISEYWSKYTGIDRAELEKRHIMAVFVESYNRPIGWSILSRKLKTFQADRSLSKPKKVAVTVYFRIPRLYFVQESKTISFFPRSGLYCTFVSY